jgi:hypothetical protein
MQTFLASNNGYTFIQPQHQQPGYAQTFQLLQSVLASSNGCAVMQHQQGYVQSLQPVQTVLTSGNGYNLMQQQQQGYIQPVQTVLTSSNASALIQPQQGYAHQPTVVSTNGVFYKIL